ncbi:MAG TPA: oligopeptide ABC transporter permease [Lapillicoccus sp.]|nr:oligopeptide ABC transporter permease [Lapillicoccus sp.]
MTDRPSLPSTTTDLLATGPTDVDLLDRADDGATSTTPLSPLRLALRRFRKHRLAVTGLVVLVLLVLVAIFAPVLAPYDPNQVDLASFQQPPSSAHWLGTDSAGRDVLSRLIYGTQVSLTVGIAAAISAGVLGLALGLMAGILGGKVDSVIMRIVEVFLSFPSLIVIILLVSILGPSITTIVLVIAVFEWPTACRIVRQMALSLREMDFVLAARAIGCSKLRIMTRHIVGGVVSPLTVVVTLLSAQAILLEAALSFLGLGVTQPQASWGGMLQRAQSLTILESMPWLWLPPGIAIAVTVLAINFVGDGLRDALDPRQQ